MDLATIIYVIITGVGLSMDAFAVSVADGLTYTDINKKRMIFIAGVFGFMQAFMPLLGYWLVEGVSQIVGATAGAKAGDVTSIVVTWLAFALLLFIGGKMLIEAIKDMKKPAEEKQAKKFTVKEVLIMGVATAIDAMAAGVTFHADKSTNATIWLHVTIVMVITFIISLIGVALAKQFQKLFKGKYEITGIIGGCILILLAVWIVLEHYVL